MFWPLKFLRHPYSYPKNHFLKLYYYPGDPEDENNKPVALKSAFKSEDEAIEYGKKFMIDLYENALSRS